MAIGKHFVASAEHFVAIGKHFMAIKGAPLAIVKHFMASGRARMATAEHFMASAEARMAIAKPFMASAEARMATGGLAFARQGARLLPGVLTPGCDALPYPIARRANEACDDMPRPPSGRKEKKKKIMMETTEPRGSAQPLATIVRPAGRMATLSTFYSLLSPLFSPFSPRTRDKRRTGCRSGRKKSHKP